jgi:N-acetylmuramoyl-L-alanine amidase
MSFDSKTKYILLISFLFASIFTFAAKDTPFVLVIDPGHGGHDPGAIGSVSQEKAINLAVALAFGNKVKANDPLVKVVYTRQTDKYLTLQERANISNNAHADLFVSIHTNAATNSAAFGCETYTLGLAKSQANLNVAMRENSVILLEDDYKQKYQGFNPKSVDSYIMFECIQDKFLDNSIRFASDIQGNFTDQGRADKGVRQAGFWVLHATAAPSVLVELGYISNKKEEAFLNSKDGQEKLANAIYTAFVKYKRDYERKSGVQSAATASLTSDTEKPSQTEIKAASPVVAEKETSDEKTLPLAVCESKGDSVVYQLQLFALGKLLPANDPAFKGLKKTSYFKENNMYKYTYGNTTSLEEIKKLKKEIASKFPDAMLISFVNGKKTIVK